MNDNEKIGGVRRALREFKPRVLERFSQVDTTVLTSSDINLAVRLINDMYITESDMFADLLGRVMCDNDDDVEDDDGDDDGY